MKRKPGPQVQHLEPAWLRKQARRSPKLAGILHKRFYPMLSDALEIADWAAKAEIEGNCLSFYDQEVRWYDADSKGANVEQSVRFLWARRRLELHPTKRNLVRPT